MSRSRFAFYYCIYKNPPRLIPAYLSLSAEERKAAVERVRERLVDEQPSKSADPFFGFNEVPAQNGATFEALQSVYRGEQQPTYLGKFKPHPADPNYSTDCSTQDAMMAYHKYDLWCQIVAQTLAEARGTIPVEDMFAFRAEEDFDPFMGKLMTFQLSILSKQDIHIPSEWEQHSVGSIQARVTRGDTLFRVRMQLRTMYLFSDTAAINLRRSRVSEPVSSKAQFSTEKVQSK